jgi:uncharacterized membrane protein YgaE (UPF0421/DUF939 family)
VGVAFGARVLKTGIAVTLSLYICMWLKFDGPVIAAVAAIFAVQPSIYRSWRSLLEQLQSNTLGAAIAMLAGSFFSKEPIAIGLVCILVIILCLKLKMEQSVSLTLVTVIAVMEASGQWSFALNRFLLILIGIGSAFILNILFFPPKPKLQFTEQIESVFARLSLLLRTAISDEMKESVFRDEKKELEGALTSLAQKYSLMEEEMKKLTKSRYREFRHLVVYKQMLHTLRRGMEVLEAVEEHYFQTIRDAATDDRFDEHLEKLLKLHEHVLLKYEDKLKADNMEAQRMEAENESFMHKTMELYAERGEDLLRLSIVAAVIYDYGFQVGRLNRLVEQYKGIDDKGAMEA